MRFRRAADRWQGISGLADETVAQQVQQDGIEILIDLMGHLGNRLLVFARRPAPVQITWFGYVGTTGMQAIDYLLADRFHVPPGEEAHHVEKILRMPHGYACYRGPDDAPEVGALPALAAGHVTFGCFNNPSKWTPPMLDAWSEILRRVRGSRLLLKYYGLQDPGTQERFHGEFQARGIEAERIRLEGWSPHRELLQAYQRVDLALDTQPYSGGATTCEALWMGVPVITWPGKTFAGRHACSHLSNAGYSQFIAQDVNGYKELAVSWANRLSELAGIRSAMRSQIKESPLCDAKAFAAALLELLSSLPGMQT
jgi:predicted O-linked N-acetylglucosamine transferase (SPINDLY family)